MIGDNASVTLIYTSGERRIVPFLAPPKAAHPLIGRDALLAKLKHRLFGGESLGLFALGGLPGVGKTALAVALAHDLGVLGHYPDGVLWAGLGRGADVLSHLGQWGAALGIPAPELARMGTVRDRAAAVAAAIGTQRMLLVADDAWQEDTALAFRIGGPGCGHILTTRLVDVARPFDGAEPETVRELSEDDGVELLKALAPDAVRKDPDKARDLVHAVGSLPLALTLMGSYLKLQAGPQSRLEFALHKLDDPEARLNLSRPLPPTASISEISLTATIAISDEALDTESRGTLYALSVFPSKPNSFSEEAAIRVSGLPVRSRAQEALWELFDAGLVESSGPDRYTLHQTVAEYARAQGADQTAHERMVRHYMDLLQDNPDFNVLDIDRANILAALGTANDQGMDTLLIDGANAAADYLDSRGLYQIDEMYLQRARTAAHRQNDPPRLANTLLNLGRIAEKRGNFADAERYLQEGLRVARNIPDSILINSHLLYLGVVEFNRGHYEESESLCLESLDMLGVSAGPNWARRSALLMRLGMIDTCRGRLDEAQEKFDEALVLAKRIKDTEKVCSLQTKLAMVFSLRSKYVTAERYLDQARDLAHQMGNLQRLVALDLGAGILERLRSECDRAKVHLDKSRSIAHQIEHRWYLSNVYNEWGEIHLMENDFGLALADFEKALSLAEELGSQDVRALSLYGLARARHAQGQHEEAANAAAESLDVLRRLRHRDYTAIEQWLASVGPGAEPPQAGPG